MESIAQIEIFKFTLIIAGAIISIMLGVIGYFMNRLVITVDKIGKKVDSMAISSAYEQASAENVKNTVHTHVQETSKKFNKVDLTLNEHDREIAKLKYHIVK